MSEKGELYRGFQQFSQDGNKCRLWGINDGVTSETHPDADLIHNYCRNPNDKETIWCYVGII